MRNKIFSLPQVPYLLLSIGFSLAVGTFVCLSRAFDALLLTTIFLIIWGAFQYSRSTYIALCTFNVSLSSAIVTYLFHDPTDSLQTITVAGLTVFILSEVIHRLVSRRRELEQKLKQSEERLSQIAQNIESTVWLADKDRFLYLSPAFSRMWALPSESHPTTREQFLSTVIDEDKPIVRQFFAKQFLEPQQVEYRIRTSDGTIRLIRDKSFPVASSSGEERVAGVAEDITAQRALEEELRQAQQMDILAKMAASAAHDFNNILTVIQSYAFLLKSEFYSKSEQKEALREIDLAVERAHDLTKRLLALTRKQKPAQKTVDPSDLIKGMMGMLAKVLDHRVKLTFQSSGEPAFIRVDRSMLEHAILNLVINARDAMPEGGTINITTSISRRCDIESTFACITVADTGVGIPPHLTKKIFEPFFTTKPLGKGTGLGLAAVDRIIKENNGFIHLSSILGRGTIFELLFPIVPAPKCVAAEKPTETTFGSADPRIVLLVENDAYIRTATKRVLTSSGYNVIDCHSAFRALQIWKGLREEIGLVISDFSLSDGFTGHELVHALKKENPGLAFLFITGDHHSVDSSSISSQILPKPCEPSLLLQTVGQLMNAQQQNRLFESSRSKSEPQWAKN